MAKSAKSKVPEPESGDDTEAVGGGEAEAEGGEDEGGAKKKSGSLRKSAAMKRSTGKIKAVSGKMASVSAPKPSGAQLIPVVCSECHEELLFDTGAQGDLVCPICEHSANRPGDAALHDINQKRGGERSMVLIGFVLFAISGACIAGWATIAQNPANIREGGLWWGTLGPAILCWLGLAVVSAKYESARWECYF